MISGDLKWNKIKEIEKELFHYEQAVLDYYLKRVDRIKGRKLAKRDIWILANKLYYIATEGLIDENETDDYSRYPYHWSVVISNVHDLAIKYKNPYYFSLSTRDIYWEQYDYLNS